MIGRIQRLQELGCQKLVKPSLLYKATYVITEVVLEYSDFNKDDDNRKKKCSFAKDTTIFIKCINIKMIRKTIISLVKGGISTVFYK